MRGGCSSDLRSHSCDIAFIDEPELPGARDGAEAARRRDRGCQHEEVLHVEVVAQEGVAQPGGNQPGLDLGLPALAILESADALLVIFTTCPTPARAALSIRFNS